ncbi:signal peptidase I [Acutalibacter sp. JLR.KK004]|uniref:signal peptidase I n=1 Tax=Acutalibacter sp. JLR.KK004 TaxID=3112622 RepID=UPI002FEEE5B2
MEDILQPMEGPEQQEKAFCSSVLEWVETIVFAIMLVSIVFTFAARVITVDGRSMEPTYQHGDRVLVSGFAGEIGRGDVVIIVHALQEPIIKRVVATEGQVVDFDPAAGELTVDGTPVKGEAFGLENGITFVPDAPGQVLDFPQTVPENCVFVLGDNRGNSTDSRFLSVGMVDHRNILGKVVFNLYPFSKLGRPS